MNKRQFKKTYPFAEYYKVFTTRTFNDAEKPKPRIGMHQYIRNCFQHRGITDMLDEKIWQHC